MIHIATVQDSTDKWIAIQLGYFRQCIREPYRIYTYLNNMEKRWRDQFYCVIDAPGTFTEDNGSGEHSKRLNVLASRIVDEADPDDILIFVDGDAFPINNSIIPFIREKIIKHKLAAIRRDENLGDIQPHPSFCATTVGFWKEIGGDWGLGSGWINARGQKIADVGGSLLEQLTSRNIDWFPLTRTGKNFFHPLYFGTYGNLIYHHGAGYRKNPARIDILGCKMLQKKKRLSQRIAQEKRYSRVFFYLAKKYLEVAIMFIISRNSLLKDYMYALIVRDRNFFLRLIKKSDKFIFVLGMHRSGTSCLAASLERSGVFLGEVSRRDPHNPKGNHELREAVKLNDDILAASGGSWRRPPSHLSISIEQRRGIRKIVKKISKHKPCGMKDPRLLLLLDAWKPIVRSSRMVGIYRHPSAVADSLDKRNKIPREEAHQLWVIYNTKLMELHKRLRFPLIEFNCSDIDALCRKISVLLLELGLMPDFPKIRSFIDPALDHNPYHSESIPDMCKNVYTYLKENSL